MKLNGKVLLVTGASRGIGRAVAEAAAERGAQVGLVARSEGDLGETLDAIRGRGCIAVADVADRDAVVAATARVVADLGAIDVVVANAGIGAYGAFAEADPDLLERLINVNVLGTFHTIQSVLPSMIDRRAGHVAIVSSVAGRIGAPFEAAYSATKFAQSGLGDALGIELAGTGVDVSVICPGVVDTDFFEARGRTYDRSFPEPVSAQDVAAAVIRAIERRRPQSFIPAWLGFANLSRHLSPALYRAGTRRTFKDELRANRS